jgi:hypothetical protein
MKRSVSLPVLIVLMLPLAADAFDGNRKGLVLGGGLGFAPHASWKANGQMFEESAWGGALHFFLGYAFDDNNMVVFEANGVILDYESEIVPVGSYFDNSFRDMGESDQAFGGLVWYHYFGARDRRAYLAGGIGLYRWRSSLILDSDNGLGIMVGVGQEITSFLQISSYFSMGRTSHKPMSGGLDGGNFEHAHLSLMITAIAF